MVQGTQEQLCRTSRLNSEHLLYQKCYGNFQFACNYRVNFKFDICIISGMQGQICTFFLLISHILELVLDNLSKDPLWPSAEPI